MGRRKLKDIHKVEVILKGLDRVVSQAASKTTNILHSTSPVEKRNSRRRGKYARGWDYEFRNKKKNNPYAKVKNRTDWQLTWLLENGHLIVNKKGGVGWSSPQPHIHKAFEETKDGFIEDCKDIDLELKIK